MVKIEIINRKKRGIARCTVSDTVKRRVFAESGDGVFSSEKVFPELD